MPNHKHTRSNGRDRTERQRRQERKFRQNERNASFISWQEEVA